MIHTKLLGMFGTIGIFLIFMSCASCFPAREIPVVRHPHASISDIDNSLGSTVAFVNPRAEVEMSGPLDPLVNRNEWTEAFCAGFYIAPNYLISASHCFQPMIRIILPDGSSFIIGSDDIDLTGRDVWFARYGEIDGMTGELLVELPHNGEIVRHDSLNDIVVIHTEDSSEFFVPLAERTADISEEVYAIGHPSGLVWSVGEGIISRYFLRDGEVFGVQTTVPTVGGCSGGPLLSQSTGEVLGMAHAYVNGHPHLSLYISAEPMLRAYNLALVDAALAAAVFTDNANN
jgi:hypothetical protein